MLTLPGKHYQSVIGAVETDEFGINGSLDKLKQDIQGLRLFGNVRPASVHRYKGNTMTGRSCGLQEKTLQFLF
jgi:hypothetical protein